MKREEEARSRREDGGKYPPSGWSKPLVHANIKKWSHVTRVYSSVCSSPAAVNIWSEGNQMFWPVLVLLTAAGAVLSCGVKI